MADFSGTGKFTLGGTDAKVYDIKFDNEGGLETIGQRATVSNCEGAVVHIQGDYSTLVDSSFSTVAFDGPTVTGDWCRILGNNFAGVVNGLEVTADNCTIEGNVFEQNGTLTPNTYDSLVITGNRNTVQGNKFDPSVGNTRYGVNVVSGECNQIVGNDLGDPDDYATDALNDGGSNTQLFWPADATYGDNFVDCGTGS